VLESLGFFYGPIVALTTSRMEHNNPGEANMIDRSEVARALAKAIAYKQCGKDTDAAEWARKLVRLLECAEILK
jgi:hypothetical protein